jgi:YD repeat-containing protein
MKLTLLVVVAALAAGCARPAYVVKSDVQAAFMRGEIAQLRETYFDMPIEEIEAANMAVSSDSLVFNSCTVVDYNRAGYITRTDVFKGKDSVHVSREEYFYDPSGTRMERAVSHNPIKRTYAATLYTYDSEGRLVHEADPIHGWRFDYGYDRRGYLRSRVDTTNLEAPLKTIYRYDRFGRLKTVKPTKGGGSKKKYSYHGDSAIPAVIRTGRTETDRYDERGNLTSLTATVVEERNKRGRVKSSFPVMLTAEYEYDPRGNWIRRVQLYKGEVQSVALRELEYWDE